MRQHKSIISRIAGSSWFFAVAIFAATALTASAQQQGGGGGHDGGGRDGGPRGGFGGRGGPSGGMQPPNMQGPGWGWGGRGGGDPEQQKLMEEIFKLDRESFELGKKFHDAKDDKERADIKKQLEETLNKTFDLKQTAQEKEVGRLEKQLSELRETVASRKKDKDGIIKSRLDKLTSKSEAHDW